MDPVIDEIKQKIDVVSLISSYIKLEKTGANYRAVCPFHAEKKPSFFVSPARQIWHCFGCASGGDIFKFIMQIEGLEFGDALRMLAQKAGVEIKKQDPRMITERKRLYEICDLASKFFEKQLFSSAMGKKAKEYLLTRGISEESIREWRIGYSPESWTALRNFLENSGYSGAEIDRAGLVVKKESGKDFYDRFRGRIMFPIPDLNSQIVGFGARVFGEVLAKEAVAKYINTPATTLYDKSRILYGLDGAKVEVRKAGECIIVEGYTDVIMSHQAGVKNVVAVSGTSLTPLHLNILKRYTENLKMAFDMDIAGDSATKRGIELAQRQGFNVKVLIMPKEDDPADVIKKEPKNWQKIIASAKSITEFYFENAFLKFDKNTADGKKGIVKFLTPAIKKISNSVENAHWVGLLAKELGIPERAIEEEIAKYKEKSENKIEEEIVAMIKPQSRREKLEERIICLLIRCPKTINDFSSKSFLFEKFSDKTRKIIELIEKNGISGEKNFDHFDEETKEYFNYLALKSETGDDDNGPEKEAKEELLDSIKEIRALNIKEELQLLSSRVKELENEGKENEANKLMEKFNQISKELIKN